MEKTNIKNTFAALNEHFTNYSGELDKTWLCESLSMVIYHTKEYIEPIRKNKKQPVKSIVWAAFIYLADETLSGLDYQTKASSEHLKKWLKSHNCGYEILEPVIKEYETERKEYNK